MDKEQLKQINAVLEEIQKEVGDGAYIFRGESNIGNGDISSSLYRSYKEICEEESDLNAEFLPGNLTARDMQIMVLQNIKEYIYAEDVDVLTELQHYGGHTNRIDFSHDYLIALFLACDGDFNKNGRLILLRKGFAEMTEPRKNQNNRVIFQRSVFVERDSGYIPKKECIIIPVPARLKRHILIYLKQYHGIGTETIYGDLPGYIDNQEIYQKAHIYFRKGVNHNEKKEYAKAIAAYDKAVGLKSNYTEAYFNRGRVYAWQHNNQKYDSKMAIDDYNKVIELNQNHDEAYNSRGIAYINEGCYKEALADFNKVIKLNPKSHHKAYNNRGVVYKNMGYETGDKRYYGKSVADYNKAIKLKPESIESHLNLGIAKELMEKIKDAKEYFQTALKLAEKQKNKEFTIHAKAEINRISSLLRRRK